MIWGYTFYQFAFNFVNYFSRNLDNLLSGYCFGDVALGYYDKAYKLMRYPVDNLTNVISPSMQPILSDHQNDVKYVEMQYNKLAKLLSVIAVYISAVCFFASREVVLIFFGSQWEGSVTCFHYLSAALFFQIVGGISGSIFQSVNRTKEMFWAGIIGSIITVVGILVGVGFGNIEMLALCYSIGFGVNFIKSQFFLAHFCFEDSFWNLTKIYIPDAIIFVALYLALSFVPTLDNLLLSLVVKVTVASVVYAVMLKITKESRVLALILPEKFRNKINHSCFAFLLK